MSSVVFAQEVVMEPEDIEIRFISVENDGAVVFESVWFSGGDSMQPYLTVLSIDYSPEPMSENVKYTTKLGEIETWEVPLWRHENDPFKKAVFTIVIHEILTRTFELRARNRYVGEESNELWSEVAKDKVIGKPGKPKHLK
jgi:hypothetical protein